MVLIELCPSSINLHVNLSLGSSTHPSDGPTVLVRSPAIGRECGFAYKPSPEALLHICDVWGIVGEEAVFVGDSAKDDVRPSYT